MTLSQLRAFTEVAAAGSVRRAAERLVVSQPAVSAAIAALERDLGTALVVRDGRGLQLTPAGRVFARYARQILGLVDEARVATLGQLHPERGRLRLAAVTTVGEHVLPDFLASFRKRYPAAEVALEIGNRSRLWELLDHREVDIVIGGRPPAGAPFVTLAERPNILVAVTAATVGEGPGRVRTVTPEQLGGQVWLLREPGSGTRSSVEELFEELGISPPIFTLGSNGAIRESARADLGVTLISRDAVKRELAAGTLQELRGPGLPRERSWCVAGRSEDELPATTALFLAHLAGTNVGVTEQLPEAQGPKSPFLNDPEGSEFFRLTTEGLRRVAQQHAPTA